MMSKYILLKVEDIEAKWREYAKLIKQYALIRTEQGKAQFMKFTGKYTILSEILATNKQIDLNEEAIEATEIYNVTEAPIQYDNNESYAWLGGRNSGYKQALIDLLKQIQ